MKIKDENLLAVKLEKYLKDNFRKRINLGIISKEFNLNTNEITKVFKSHFNRSIVDYMIELRINYTKELLKKTKLSIYEIALDSGYTTISNFNRQFKEVNGMTPMEYRKSLKKIK